jgi:ribosomal protein L37E
MDEFIGQKCLICGGVFEKDADIAVCPECGTPYHRACYKKSGKCINKTLHETHTEWVPSASESKKNGETLCKRCGKQNSQTALFCESCGFPLDSFIKTENAEDRERVSAEQNIDSRDFEGISDELIMNPALINFDDPLCGFNPEEVFDEDVKLSEIAEYVNKNTRYYLPVFKNIKKFGSPLIFNFTALFFPELYFSYRKMPFYAFGALIIRMFLEIPSFIQLFAANTFQGFAGFEIYEKITAFAGTFDTSSEAFQALLMIFSICNLIRMWYYASKANTIYYRKVITSIRFLREIYAKRVEFPEYFENIDSFDGYLKKKGGTSVVLLLFFAILIFLPPICIMTAFQV